MSTLVTSQSAFPPRKEFLKSQATTHQFALLTFNGADILRLSNFPPNVITSLRNLFDVQKVYKTYREDAEMGVCEFVMSEKLWSGKSIRTERLATLVFSVLVSHHFRFVTTLAYGRLPQDTRSLVFTRSVPALANQSSTSHSGSPAVPLSPLPSASLTALDPSRGEQRTCFALSLTSKSLRVICAPKNSTPAILASVRSAWPRGIVSEDRLEEDVYEFTLKGYSLFSSSSYDRDALVHIFALLRALDAYSFQLITNLNLTQGIAKSRTKDLWIFDAPADPPSPPNSQHASSSRHSSLLGPYGKGKDPERVMSTATATTAGMAGLGAGYNAYLAPTEGVQHMRAATSPSPLGRSEPLDGSDIGHVRAATTPTPAPPEKPGLLGRSLSVIRKAPPQAFVPLTVEKPKRRGSRGSITMESPVPLSGGDGAHRPPALTTAQSYQSQATVTPGPLSESEFAYGYEAATSGGPHPDSVNLYREYEPPTDIPVGAIIYSAGPSPTSQAHPHRAISPQHTDDGLLSANAFRETGYSGTSDPPPTWTAESNSVNASPSEIGETTPTAVDVARTAHAPLPHQPQLGNGQSVYSSSGRPKSEKALLGVIPSPPPHSFPPVSMDRPGPGRMESTTSTILPPGGFPKTPITSFVGPSSPVAVQEPTRQRNGSSGTVPTLRTRVGSKSDQGHGHHRSASTSEGKGWVLVNVEPNSRKDSIDAATAAMDGAAKRQRGKSQPDTPTVTNIRTNDPSTDAHATADATDSPIDGPHIDFDSQPRMSGEYTSADPLRKRSLRKKQPLPAPEPSASTPTKKKLFGLFRSGSKNKRKKGSTSDDDATASPVE